MRAQTQNILNPLSCHPISRSFILHNDDSKTKETLHNQSLCSMLPDYKLHPHPNYPISHKVCYNSFEQSMSWPKKKLLSTPLLQSELALYEWIRLNCWLIIISIAAFSLGYNINGQKMGNISRRLVESFKTLRKKKS